MKRKATHPWNRFYLSCCNYWYLEMSTDARNPVKAWHRFTQPLPNFSGGKRDCARPPAPAAIIASRWQIIKPAAVLAATTPSVVVMRCNRHVLWSPHISQQFLRSANNEQRTEQIACERGENWPRWQIAERTARASWQTRAKDTCHEEENLGARSPLQVQKHTNWFIKDLKDATFNLFSCLNLELLIK